QQKQAAGGIAAGAGGISEDPDADEECAGSADPRPYRVGRAHGDVALGEPQQPAADGEAHHGQCDADDALLGALGELETDGPPDLEQPGDDEVEPAHPSIMRRTPPPVPSPPGEG